MKALVRHFGVAGETGSRCLSSRIVGRFGGTRFQQGRISGSLRFFTALVQFFRSRGKKSKLFFTDALNACNKVLNKVCERGTICQ